MSYDFSRIGAARRRAIEALDEYGCTIPEFCAMFGISAATFHRYAEGIRLQRRPSEPSVPMMIFESKAPPPIPISAPDALEIATIALLKARFTVAEIVEALRKTSKSAVYRQRDALRIRSEELSPAEARLRPRHLPSWIYYGYLRPEERRLATRRRRERWVTRGRVPSGT